MKTINSQGKQRGFFDLGIGLGLLLLFGGTSVVISSNHEAQRTFANQETETTTNEITATKFNHNE